MIRMVLLMIPAVFCSCLYAQKCKGQRINISPGTDSGFTIKAPEVWNYHPGDTIILNSFQIWSYLRIDNYKGSATCPLVIINDNGQVKFKGAHGIEITNSTYIKLTGTGSKDHYGIFLEGEPVYRLADGKGVEAHMRSKNIELSNISVHNMGFGFVCRTDNFCEDSLTFPNWVIDSVSIHDCRLVGIWYEGMYLGNTSPDNAKDSYDPRPIVCNGDTVYPMPMRNGDMKVYGNYVDSTGRGGIQLASASMGMSEIYNNTVRHNGLNGDMDQGTGISIGTYTHVYIHDNMVSNTFTSGIASLGGSGTGTVLRIENNSVDSSGYLSVYDLSATSKRRMNPAKEPVFRDSLSWPCSVYIGTRPTLFRDSTTFQVKNNSIGIYKSAKAAIEIYDDYTTITKSGNIICRNKNTVSKTRASLYTSNAKGIIHYTDDCL